MLPIAANFANELLTTRLELRADACCRSQTVCLTAPRLAVKACLSNTDGGNGSREKKFRSSLGGGLLIGLGISAFQIMTWFLLGVWNPISIATVLDMLLVPVEDFRPMESLIGLQNMIDGTSFFGLPASVAFAVVGFVLAAHIRATDSAGNERRRLKARLLS